MEELEPIPSMKTVALLREQRERILELERQKAFLEHQINEALEYLDRCAKHRGWSSYAVAHVERLLRGST